jgi:hypothetical protein
VSYGIEPRDVDVPLVPPMTAAEERWWVERRWQVIPRQVLRNAALAIAVFGGAMIISGLFRLKSWEVMLAPSRLVFLASASLAVSAVATAVRLRLSARKHEILVKRFYEELEAGEGSAAPPERRDG